MAKTRLYTLLIVFLLIVVGLISRRISIVPLFIGDILWAMMVYFIFRTVLIASPVKTVFICSLLFSYAIECSQLYHAPWINHLRRTLLGKLILGQGFLWSDLLCYSLGVALCAWADQAFKTRRADKSHLSI